VTCMPVKRETVRKLLAGTSEVWGRGDTASPLSKFCIKYRRFYTNTNTHIHIYIYKVLGTGCLSLLEDKQII